MKRTILAALMLLVFSAATTRKADAQAEMIYYRGPDGKETELKGKIKNETPGGVTITIGKEDKVVPAMDVLQVCYGTNMMSPAEVRALYGKITTAMKQTGAARRAALQRAINEYNDAAPRVGDNPYAARYVQFRIADLQFIIAQEDRSQRPMALKALEDYAAANPGGWEIVPVLNTLAISYEKDGDLPKAMSALQRLADLPDAPKDLRLKGNVAVSQMLMRAKDFPKAEERLKALLDSLPPGDPQRAHMQVCLVQCQVAQGKSEGAEKLLKDAISLSQASDALLRGAAYNALGDYYRGKGMKEDAFWAYLRVDTMYSVDASEHAKAIYYLSELFKDKKFDDRTGDLIRAKNYRDRLLTDPRFANSEYRKMAEK